MKKLTIVFAALLAGCAARAPISYQEYCALDGMVLRSVTTASGSAIAFGGRPTTVKSSSEAISCEPPQSPSQRCEVEHLAAEAKPKHDYNSTVGKWNLGIGVGYVLWILPGVGMKLWSDAKYDKAIATAAEQTRAPACDASEKVPTQSSDR